MIDLLTTTNGAGRSAPAPFASATDAAAGAASAPGAAGSNDTGPTFDDLLAEHIEGGAPQMPWTAIAATERLVDRAGTSDNSGKLPADAPVARRSQRTDDDPPEIDPSWLAGVGNWIAAQRLDDPAADASPRPAAIAATSETCGDAEVPDQNQATPAPNVPMRPSAMSDAVGKPPQTPGNTTSPPGTSTAVERVLAAIDKTSAPGTTSVPGLQTALATLTTKAASAVETSSTAPNAIDADSPAAAEATVAQQTAPRQDVSTEVQTANANRAVASETLAALIARFQPDSNTRESAPPMPSASAVNALRRAALLELDQPEIVSKGVQSPHAIPAVVLPLAESQQISPELGKLTEATSPVANSDLEGRVVEQVVQAIRLQWQLGGPGEATIQLHPEHLGAMTVSLKVEHGQVSADIKVESATVQQIISSNENDLQSALARQGLTLERMTVTQDAYQQRQFQRQPRSHQQPNRRRRTDDEAVFELGTGN